MRSPQHDLDLRQLELLRTMLLRTKYDLEITMQNVLKQKVTIQPGGIVHIELPELVPGSIADVIIIPETAAEPPASLTSLIGTAAGGFATPHEADVFIRQERNTWQA